MATTDHLPAESLPIPAPVTSADDRIVATCRWLLVLQGAFFVLTWPLWQRSGTFPQIPFFAWARSLPDFWDLAMLGGIFASLILVALATVYRQFERGSLGLLVLFVLGSALVDQSRWQPWLQQMLWFSILMILAPSWQATRSMRWLVMSIYLYSALSRIDLTFSTTLGVEFCKVAARQLGFDFTALPQQVQGMMIIGLSVGEIITAIGLFIPWTRRPAAVAAILMHCALISVLGPWGMNHYPGVLFWNLTFALHVANLCLRRRVPRSETLRDPSSYMAWGVLLLMLIWPRLQPLGYCDHWPAWQLYAPHTSRAQLLIATPQADQLPAELQPYLERFPERGYILRLDRWSLEERHAPLYPQLRTQLAICLQLVHEYQLLGRAMIIEQSAANWKNGRRETESLSNLQQFDAAGEKFWLNLQARPTVK